MNDYFDKHPLMQYTLTIVLILSLNIFWRWNKVDVWTDLWMFSILNTALLGGGVIIGDRLRRKQNKKNRAAKEKIDYFLEKD